MKSFFQLCLFLALCLQYVNAQVNSTSSGDTTPFHLTIGQQQIKTSSLFYENFNKQFVRLRIEKNKILLQFLRDGVLLKSKKLNPKQRIKNKTDFKYNIKNGVAKCLLTLREKEVFNYYLIEIDLENLSIIAEKSLKTIPKNTEKWNVDLSRESGDKLNYVARCYTRKFGEKDHITVFNNNFEIVYETEVNFSDKIDFIQERLNNAPDGSTIDNYSPIFKDILKAHSYKENYPFPLRAMFMSIQLSKDGKHLVYGVKAAVSLPNYAQSEYYTLSDMNRVFVVNMENGKERKIELFENKNKRNLLQRYYKIKDNLLLLSSLHESIYSHEITQEITVYNFDLDVALSSQKKLEIQRLQHALNSENKFTEIDIISLVQTDEFKYNTVLSVSNLEYLKDKENNTSTAIRTLNRELIQIHSDIEYDDIELIRTPLQHLKEGIPSKFYILHVLANKILKAESEDYILLATLQLNIRQKRRGNTRLTQSDLESIELLCIDAKTGTIVRKSINIDDTHYYKLKENLQSKKTGRNEFELIRLYEKEKYSEAINIKVTPYQ